MTIIAITGPLTGLQIEILKLYSTKMSEAELYELKLLLTNHYAKKAADVADALWDKCGFSDEHMRNWLNEN
ncbi:MAG: hypothetical protein ACOCG5_00275 [Candidatus Alkaliphilus sp. MAG34]|nr:hypothetical protein [Clostridiales bacterium]